VFLGLIITALLPVVGVKKAGAAVRESPGIFVWIVLVNLLTLFLFFVALTKTANIAVVNILYSSRAALIVPLAYSAALLIRLHIDKMTRRTFMMRLAGGILMFAAICVAVWSSCQK
jgi:hypothetical protein